MVFRNLRNTIKSELVGIVIGIIVSVIGIQLLRFYIFMKGQEKWGFQDLSNVNIIISSIENKNQTPETTTGRGQVIALNHILNDFQSIYGNITDKIYLATDIQTTDKYRTDENNIVLLGGPVTNLYSKKFLDDNSIDLVASIDTNGIFWKQSQEIFKSDYKINEINNKTDYANGKDYGLIIKKENFNNVILLFAGHETHGTGCAAKYYSRRFSKNVIEYLFLENIAIVVECKISENSIESIKKIKEDYNW